MRSGHPLFSGYFHSILTQVHSIAASPGIYPPRPGCRRLPLGTSFHSSHKPSISLSICTGTSSCEVGNPAFLTISFPLQTQVHTIVASPRNSPPRTGCRRLPQGSSFHSSHKPPISLSICNVTSSSEVGTPAFLKISTLFKTQVHSIVAIPRSAPSRAWCLRLPLGTTFHFSHKSSISLSIFTGTSNCEVSTPPF